MAAGNDPRFTIARAWLQVTPSVRPYSFKAMHIHKGGYLKIIFLLQIDYIIPSVILHQAIKNAAYNAPALMLIAKTATKGVQFM